MGERALSGGSLHRRRAAGRHPRRTADYNGLEQEGVGYYQVNQTRGRRWTVVDAYLRPALGRPNLKVVTHAHVTRLEIEGRRATGVRYRRDGRDVLAKAKGTWSSPPAPCSRPICSSSRGIGHPDVLTRAGVVVRHAPPGVGNNYQDHFATRMNWRVSQPITLNELSRGWRLGKAVAQYSLTRNGILTLGTGLAFGFVKTRPELETPDIQYFFMHASYANAADQALDRLPGMTIGVAQLRPQSVGLIHVKSADPFAQPPSGRTSSPSRGLRQPRGGHAHARASLRRRPWIRHGRSR